MIGFFLRMGCIFLPLHVERDFELYLGNCERSVVQTGFCDIVLKRVDGLFQWAAHLLDANFKLCDTCGAQNVGCFFPGCLLTRLLPTLQLPWWPKAPSPRPEGPEASYWKGPPCTPTIMWLRSGQSHPNAIDSSRF